MSMGLAGTCSVKSHVRPTHRTRKGPAHTAETHPLYLCLAMAPHFFVIYEYDTQQTEAGHKKGR